MGTQHAAASLDLAAERVSPGVRTETLRVLGDYWTLTKPEVNLLILITAFAGFYLASKSSSSGFRILPAVDMLLGTLFVASGAGALNQFLERFYDAQMRRTARRPIASGRVEPSHALWFGISLSLAGIVFLALSVNLLATLLALATLLTYLFLYTPLKRSTSLCTLVGAFPGAVPPLIGWAAARGRLDPQAWVLFAIVFCWQFPHFMAIAWMYREDYARAGYLVLPSDERRDRFFLLQTLGASLALIPLSLIPSIAGESGLIYSIGALILGSIFSHSCGRFTFHRTNVGARQLLTASIVYLPAIFILMMVDKK
jgi:protoheme IX farnesyltransferase